MVKRLEINSKKNVVIKLEIPEEDYKILSKIAKSKGYSLPNDYLRELIISSVEKGNVEQSQLNKELIETISKRIERVMQDLLNPFTQKIDDLSSRIADLVESIEETKIEKSQQPLQKEEPKSKKKTAIEILKEQGVIFSDDVQWLRYPDAYFKKLESSGAIVIYLDNERVALDKDFWDRFRSKLATIAIKDPKEVEDLLASDFGENGSKLFNKLVKKGLVFYDEDMKSWNLSINQ
jgi:tRNA(His) 5'-end guanylyltransferase